MFRNVSWLDLKLSGYAALAIMGYAPFVIYKYLYDILSSTLMINILFLFLVDPVFKEISYSTHNLFVFLPGLYDLMCFKNFETFENCTVPEDGSWPNDCNHAVSWSCSSDVSTFTNCPPFTSQLVCRT